MSGKREQAQIPRSGPTAARALPAIRGLPLVLPCDWPTGGDVTEWRGDGAEWRAASEGIPMISRHESFLWSSGRAGTVDGGPWVAELLGYIALRVAIARGAGDLVPLQGRSPDDRAAAAALCNSRSHSVAVSPQMMLTSAM